MRTMRKANAETSEINQRMDGLQAAGEDSNWNLLYKIGALAALIAILVYLIDIAISFTGGNTPFGTQSAIGWFGRLNHNLFLGLRELGIFNVISFTVGIPLYVALYGVHRRVYKVYAILAVILYMVGIGIYLSSNAAIPMAVLSSKYAVAATDTQRTLLAAAGEAILARGEDFTPGIFVGFFLAQIASILMSVVMLRGRIFSKATAYAGIMGNILLAIFTIWTTFTPALYNVALMLAMVGGLLGLAWYIMTARRLLQMGRQGVSIGGLSGR